MYHRGRMSSIHKSLGSIPMPNRGGKKGKDSKLPIWQVGEVFHINFHCIVLEKGVSKMLLSPSFLPKKVS